MPEYDAAFIAEQLHERHHLGSFIRLDRYGGLAGLIVAAGAAFVLDERGVWWLVLALAIFVTAMTYALRTLGAGHLDRALAITVGANLLVAAVVAVLLPFLWPVMALNVVMGIAVVAPYVSSRTLVYVIGGGVCAAVAIALVGFLRLDQPQVELGETGEWIVVAGGLVAQMVPIAAIIWQNNRRQEAALTESLQLNDDLRRSEQEVVRSRQRVVRAADAERSRIERDLHDGAQQRLVALGVHLRLLQSQAKKGPLDDLPDTVSMLVDELDGAIDDLRELAHGIYPPLLEARGLAEAFGAVARRSASPVTVEASDVGRFDPAIEAAVYFSGLEALANAAKHAPGAAARVQLAANTGTLTLTVSDEGDGFDPSLVSESRGMRNMSDRLAAVGGSLIMRSRPGSGTTVFVDVPDAKPLP